jgi:NAD(P)H dehydrogenase (quinone)
VVFSHPRRNSFSGAILDSFSAGLRAQGHSVEVADLYGEGFDPRLKSDDFAQFEDRPMPADIRFQQARVDRADALAFVFPVWWWSLPAMLKGWIDRVWSSGWAYTFTAERSQGLLVDRPTILLCTAGSRATTYVKYGYDLAMHTQIAVGILSYCGIHDIATHVFYEVDDNQLARKADLYLARRLGEDFLAPGRAPNDVRIHGTRPV